MRTGLLYFSGQFLENRVFHAIEKLQLGARCYETKEETID
jgi:hypothetical protein